MSWYDDEIAGPMGYQYCVLFDCARAALRAYPFAISLPGNICRSVYEARPDATLEEVDQTTGLVKEFSPPTHLYGYQSPATREHFPLALDPLMTGWIRRLKSDSAIISFGLKKMLPMGYGGAFLTNNVSLAEEMGDKGHWNDDYTDLLRRLLPLLKEFRLVRFDKIDLWDRYLGDSLIRIPAEQIMPWRVMRRAHSREQRDDIVFRMRNAGLDVGTNYPPLTGTNVWGDTVLNFFCPFDIEKADIHQATEIVKRVVNPPFRIGIDG